MEPMILAAKGWRFLFTFLNLFSRAWTPWPATSAGLETSLARAQYTSTAGNLNLF